MALRNPADTLKAIQEANKRRLAAGQKPLASTGFGVNEKGQKTGITAEDFQRAQFNTFGRAAQAKTASQPAGSQDARLAQARLKALAPPQQADIVKTSAGTAVAGQPGQIPGRTSPRDKVKFRGETFGPGQRTPTPGFSQKDLAIQDVLGKARRINPPQSKNQARLQDLNITNAVNTLVNAGIDPSLIGVPQRGPKADTGRVFDALPNFGANIQGLASFLAGRDAPRSVPSFDASTLAGPVSSRAVPALGGPAGPTDIAAALATGRLGSAQQRRNETITSANEIAQQQLGVLADSFGETFQEIQRREDTLLDKLAKREQEATGILREKFDVQRQLFSAQIGRQVEANRAAVERAEKFATLRGSIRSKSGQEAIAAIEREGERAVRDLQERRSQVDKQMVVGLEELHQEFLDARDDVLADTTQKILGLKNQLDTQIAQIGDNVDQAVAAANEGFEGIEGEMVNMLVNAQEKQDESLMQRMRFLAEMQRSQKQDQFKEIEQRFKAIKLANDLAQVEGQELTDEEIEGLIGQSVTEAQIAFQQVQPVGLSDGLSQFLRQLNA